MRTGWTVPRREWKPDFRDIEKELCSHLAHEVNEHAKCMDGNCWGATVVAFIHQHGKKALFVQARE